MRDTFLQKQVGNRTLAAATKGFLIIVYAEFCQTCPLPLASLPGCRALGVVSVSCSSCGGRGSVWTAVYWRNCCKTKAPLGAHFSGQRVGDTADSERSSD